VQISPSVHDFHAAAMKRRLRRALEHTPGGGHFLIEFRKQSVDDRHDYFLLKSTFGAAFASSGAAKNGCSALEAKTCP
jgi:hypothetical protein